jgi:hypothetical protein
MADLDIEVVEKEIVKVVQEAADLMGVPVKVDAGCAPGGAGISSQVLVTVMCRLEGILNVIIPDNCYIFHDRTSLRQLTIREASEKLLKVLKNGKNVR